MFVLIEEKLDRLVILKLFNTHTGEYGCVLPEFGGNLNELVLLKPTDKNLISVMDGYATFEEAQENSGYKGAKLLPFPNRIGDGQYMFDGVTHELSINRPQEGHAIHGLFYAQPMQVKKVKTGKEAVSVTLEYKYNGKMKGYPFPCRVQMTYKLNEKGITCKTNIKNIGSQVMPLGDGWHPYFKLDTATVDSLLLKLPPCEDIIIDSRKLPTHETELHHIFSEVTPIAKNVLDNGYRLLSLKDKAITVLQHPTDAYQLQIVQDTGKHKYNYLQVYIPADRKTIAIEPMSCATNAFNNGFGLIKLKPDATYKAAYKVRLKKV